MKRVGSCSATGALVSVSQVRGVALRDPVVDRCDREFHFLRCGREVLFNEWNRRSTIPPRKQEEPRFLEGGYGFSWLAALPCESVSDR